MVQLITSETLKKKYVKFFLEHNHKRIANAPIIPENDPTALFISAGMHPLVPYLLGQPHPSGKRLVNVQKCIRTQDIESVGDKTHHTFLARHPLSQYTAIEGDLLDGYFHCILQSDASHLLFREVLDGPHNNRDQCKETLRPDTVLKLMHLIGLISCQKPTSV